MVSCLKTKKQNTQAAKSFLVTKGWLDTSYCMGKSGKYVLLAITDKADTKAILTKFIGSIEQRNIQKVKLETRTIKDALSKVIPTEELDKINRGFEAIGDIAVIEIPEGLSKLEVNIAWALKRIHKHIKVVAKKDKKTSGKYRIRKVKVLVGDMRTETVHKESGARLKLDLNKVYFSPKLGSERLRILRQVKPKENILNMFAGVGPYPIVFAKNKKDITQTAIELNPAAVRYFKQNLKLNKLEKRITLIKGDAKVEVPKLKQKFDRIIMVLPEKAHEFLPHALKVANKGAMIHIYQFEARDDADRRAQELKKMTGAKAVKPVRAGGFSPKIDRFCFDIQLP